jgi:hypothetical protein
LEESVEKSLSETVELSKNWVVLIRAVWERDLMGAAIAEIAFEDVGFFERQTDMLLLPLLPILAECCDEEIGPSQIAFVNVEDFWLPAAD